MLDQLGLDSLLKKRVDEIDYKEKDAIKKWSSFKQVLVHNKLVPFDIHLYLYKRAFSSWDYSKGPPPVWIPTEKEISDSNIGKLMKEKGFFNYHDLHKWSVENRGDFWEFMVEKLGIRFYNKTEKILNGSAENPQWLKGAKFNIVDSCFKAPKDKTAIIYRKGNETKRISYGELEKLVNRVSNGLVELGLKPGDSVAIDMAMNYECVAIYLGIVKAGCVVVSISESFAPDQIERRLKLGNCRVVFTQDYNVLKEGKKIEIYKKTVEAGAEKCVVLFYEKTDRPILRKDDMSFYDFLSENDSFDAVFKNPDDIMNILFSSGTTAEPKAIPWTHTTPIKSASDGYLHQNITENSVVCWPTSIGWMMGPWLIYATFINNATMALNTISATSREMCEFIQDSGVTVLGLVPSIVKAWRKDNVVDGLDWSKIELFSSTGECSNEEDYLYLMSLAGYKPVIEYLGGTEIGGAHITGTVVQSASPSTFTTPALGIDIVILDEDGNESDKGELFILPPSIGLSETLLNKDHEEVYYQGCPRFDGNVLRRHGDEMEVLGNGYYKAHGRVDDCMKLGGAKTSSAEIERAVRTLPYIEDAAAIGINPKEGGPTKLVMYIVLTEYVWKDQVFKEAQESIKKLLNPLYKISDIVIAESLPRTASNKVMRRVLRNEYMKKNDL